jgi:hypothetical protein
MKTDEWTGQEFNDEGDEWPRVNPAQLLKAAADRVFPVSPESERGKTISYAPRVEGADRVITFKPEFTWIKLGAYVINMNYVTDIAMTATGKKLIISTHNNDTLYIETTDAGAKFLIEYFGLELPKGEQS